MKIKYFLIGLVNMPLQWSVKDKTLIAAFPKLERSPNSIFELFFCLKYFDNLKLFREKRFSKNRMPPAGCKLGLI